MTANRARPHQTSTAPCYDRTSVLLHWATAILVLTQFSLANVWEQLQRGSPPRLELIAIHVSLGMSLAVVLVVRLVWRLARGRRLPPAVSGLQRVAADGAHFLLYGLLLLQVMLGFALGWGSGNGMSFFGLFSLPSMLTIPAEWRHAIVATHNFNAWAIITIAGVHAAAALLHHYAFHDNVLRRMRLGS